MSAARELYRKSPSYKCLDVPAARKPTLRTSAMGQQRQRGSRLQDHNQLLLFI